MTTVIKLDKTASQQVLDSAIRTHAQIVLESPAWNETTINGYLISGDEEALLVEVTGRPAVNTQTLIGATCDAQVYGDRRYQFSTKITAAPQWGASRSIALSRPDGVRVFERRRALRAKLAPSSQVRLEWTHEGLARRYTATMLNISPDGLACRIDGPAAQALATDDILMTRFSLPYAPQAFDLEARVMNITPTDEGRNIVGLQFVHSQRSGQALVALRLALQGKRTTSRTEVFA